MPKNNSKNEDLPNFHKINENLFRGGQPTAEGIKQLAELGIKTIVTFREMREKIQREKELADIYWPESGRWRCNRRFVDNLKMFPENRIKSLFGLSPDILAEVVIKILPVLEQNRENRWRNALERKRRYVSSRH